MTSLYSHDIFFGFILVAYQTGLWEKYLVTGDWSQSRDIVIASVHHFICHAIFSTTTEQNLTKLATGLPHMVRIWESYAIFLSVSDDFLVGLKGHQTCNESVGILR